MSESRNRTTQKTLCRIFESGAEYAGYVVNDD